MTISERQGQVDPRAALIVVDVQNGFVNRHSRGVIPAIVRLVEGWQRAGAPVVFARFHNPAGSPYERLNGWTRLRTPEEQALVDELAPFAASAAGIIDKPGSSILTPNGARLVSDAGWRDLVICGIDTDSCVYDSAIAAYQAGYRPWIVTDACASSGGPQYHEAALLLAGRNVGRKHLVTIDDILARLGAGREASA